MNRFSNLKKTIKSIHLKKIFRHFLWLFLFITLVISGLFLILAEQEKDHMVEKVAGNETRVATILKNYIYSDLDTVYSDLLFLVEDFQAYMNGVGDKDNGLQEIENTFIRFLNARKQYDQVRFIDVSGREVVRVNYGKNGASSVFKKKLQDKSSRYYFENSIRLDAGRVYVSPFDLNIEKGEVERPFKPMIRIGSPVFYKNGEKAGIIILNFLGNTLLNHIEEIKEKSKGYGLLLNPESYYLFGMTESDEWGFMFGNRKDAKFSVQFPVEWKRIESSLEGQFTTHKGLFTYVTYHPLAETMLKRHSELMEQHQYHENEEHWKFVHFYPTARLDQKIMETLKPLMITYVSLIFLTAVISFFYARNAVIKRSLIEKLKDNEATLDNIFNISPDSIRLINHDFTIAKVNQNYIQNFGSPRLENQKHLCYQHLKTKVCKTENCMMRRVFDGETFIEEDVTLENRKGFMRWFSLSITPYTDNQGNVLGVLENFKDITSRKKSEGELERAKVSAEKANRAKSQFLANMSHEIRTPLNAVIGFGELLATTPMNDQQQNYLQSINIAGRSLLTLINDILDLSKIEAGMLEIKTVLVESREVFYEIEQIFKLKISEKGLKFSLDIDPRLPQMMLIDEIRVRQVLLNLMGNAVKFTHKGYIKLSVKVTLSDDEKEVSDLMIGVEDTGIGVSPKDQHLIFESFKQQSSQDNRAYGGTGLGLSITKRLVEMMNGEIRLNSEVDKGSCFEVHLKNIMIGEPQRQVKQTEVDCKTTRFKKALVLVVDDIDSNREWVNGFLVHLGLEIIEATNGKVALELIKRFKPDLVLMDIRMPVLDGIGAIKVIRQTQSSEKMPVIALTASVSSQELKTFQRLGFNEYIQKPVDTNILISVLSRYLSTEPPVYITEMSQKGEREMMDHLTDIKAKDLKFILEKELLPLANTLQGAFKIKDARIFSDVLIHLGEKQEVDLFIDMGKRIQNAADLFDLEKIHRDLDLFMKLLENL